MSQPQPKMIKKPVSELEGAQLDWAVANANGIKFSYLRDIDGEVICCVPWVARSGASEEQYTPSRDWSQGGDIIEREVMTVDGDNARAPFVKWRAVTTSKIKDGMGWYPRISCHGSTALIAAMRVFVKSRLGDEVEVPA